MFTAPPMGHYPNFQGYQRVLASGERALSTSGKHLNRPSDHRVDETVLRIASLGRKLGTDSRGDARRCPGEESAAD